MEADLQELLRRLDELESQAAFRDDLQQRLNDVVARHDHELTRLQAQVATLARRLLELGESLPDPSATGDEVPPHY